MWMDKRSEMCVAASLALTAGASWQNVGSTIDTQADTKNLVSDIGTKDTLYIIMQIVAAVTTTSGDAGTMTFRVVSDDSAVPNVSTATVHWTSTAKVTDDSANTGLTAALVLLRERLWPQQTYERYVGVQVLVTTETTNAGTLNCFLTPDISRWMPYADNVSN